MSPEPKAPKSYSVPAVARAIDVIELLVSSTQPRNVSEISRQLKIPKSSAFGILQTLRARGYVEKVEDDRYALSLKLVTLGSSMVASLDLRQKIGPLVRELAAQTQLTGHVAVLESDEAVYIDKADVPGGTRSATYVGWRAPLHCTAIGKALLSGLPESEVDRIITRAGLPSYTPRTITKAPVLKAELAQIRQAGYAVSLEEKEPGVCGVAAPVFDHSGEIAAAVNLGGTTLQIKRKDFKALGTTVARAAKEMSRRLGYV